MSETCEQTLLGKGVEACLLQDSANFRSPRDKKLQSLCLTESELRHTDASGSPFSLDLKEVIGANAGAFDEKGKGGNKGEDYHKLEVFAYVQGGQGQVAVCTRNGNSAGRCKRSAAHKTWLVSSADVAAAWAAAINDALRGRYLDPALRSERAIGPGRRLLVLINPVSGTGRSLTAWKNTLRPMLEQALVIVTTVVSKRRGELTEIIAGAEGGRCSGTEKGDDGSGAVGETPASVGSLDDFDGIVTIGGDGTLFEVLQGLYARPDCERQLSRMSLGIIPTGSGNALAKTLSEESGEDFGIFGASFLVAKGHTKPMDLSPTDSGNKKFLGFLTTCWGMISDVDMESEAYRWLGSLRFTVGTLVRITRLKHYSGRISFLPAIEGGVGSEVSTAPFRLPPLTEPIHSVNSSANGGGSGGWTTVEGQFVLAAITQTKFLSHDMPLAPSSRLGDGLMDLFYIKKGASRIGMIKMFMAMEKGEHLGPKYPHIEWHRVRAFRLEPLSSDGRITLDGELVDYVPVQQYVWPKATNIMCLPEPYPAASDM